MCFLLLPVSVIRLTEAARKIVCCACRVSRSMSLLFFFSSRWDHMVEHIKTLLLQFDIAFKLFQTPDFFCLNSLHEVTFSGFSMHSHGSWINLNCQTSQNFGTLCKYFDDHIDHPANKCWQSSYSPYGILYLGTSVNVRSIRCICHPSPTDGLERRAGVSL